MPELVVFDLDMCMWAPEMYELSEVPDETCVVQGALGDKGNGVVGVRSGGDTIRLFEGALTVLQQYHAGEFPGVKLAAASSADTPLAVRIGRAAMDLLEVVPGVTMRQVFRSGWPGDVQNMQIGRAAPLSSDKSKTHFPILQRETGVPYEKMLFFDDCIWGDHCAKVARHCPGVVTVRTPSGLTLGEWEQGLKMYAGAAATRS